MSQVQVTYYSGDWPDDERAAIRSALESRGFEVGEDEGTKKGYGLEIPPQLMIDFVQVVRGVADIARDAEPFASLIASVLAIFAVFKGRKRDGTMQVFVPHRIYIVMLEPPAADEASIPAIVDDYADGDDDRRGDMTWRDGRWLTVEELHDPRRVSRARARRAGRPRRGLRRA
jgi:hypothetical protein